MGNQKPLSLQCVDIAEKMNSVRESEELISTDDKIKLKTECLLKLARICRDLASKIEELEKHI